MGLTARPSKSIDLSKIDEIQNEFFNDKSSEEDKKISPPDDSSSETLKSPPVETDPIIPPKSARQSETAVSKTPKISKKEKIAAIKPVEKGETEQGNLKIADLLATPKIQGIRHTSRPYTVPRSLTIDLNRLKSKFRARNLQFTQNELMDKMLLESLELINSENFYEQQEKAFTFVKSPDQCSRRSVTLTEKTVSEMNELKADLALKYNRRFSADEIFTTLLAVAFLPLYEESLISQI